MENELQQKLEQIVQEKKAYIIPSNIKTGVTIFGVTGNVQPGTDTSDANAEAWALLSGYTAYANGEKIEGNMKNLGEVTYSPSDDTQIIPAGYITGGTIKAADITDLQEYEECMNLSEEILGNTFYTRLEYIEGTGTQYILTSYHPTQNTGYELKYSNHTIGGLLYGAYNSDWHNIASSGFFCSSLGGDYYWFHYSGNWNTNLYNTGTGQNNISVVGNQVTIEGVGSYVATPQASSFRVSYGLCIWGGNKAGTIDNITAYRLHEFKILDTGVVQHHFIPVKRTEDGAICLYDLIENKFYENQGTGEFIAGPVFEEVTNG